MSDASDPPGPLLASGRAADVFDLGDGTVLRRYRLDGFDCEYEARVMRHVADAGIRVPKVDSTARASWWPHTGGSFPRANARKTPSCWSGSG